MSKGKHAQCFDAYAPLRAVRRCVSDGHPVMILMRGVPGSGKTHLARELCSLYEGGVVFSTDEYFERNGKYEYDPQKLDEYHRNNIIRARDAMKDDVKPVIIDNTNIRGIHMKQYVQHAVTYFYEVYIVEPDTGWKMKASECARRNSHNVDKPTIIRMFDLLDSEGKPSLQSLIGKDRLLSVEVPLGQENFDDDVMDSQYVTQQHQHVTNGFLPPPSFSSLLAGRNSGQTPVAAPLSPSAFSAFSMAHSVRPTVVKTIVRDVAIQASQVSIALNLAGIDEESLPDDIFCAEPVERERAVTEKPETKDRPAPKGSDGGQERRSCDLDLLVSMFPDESMGQLLHWYRMLGLLPTIRLLHEQDSCIKYDAVVEEGAFVPEVAECELSGTVSRGPTNHEYRQLPGGLSDESFQVGGRLGNDNQNDDVMRDDVIRQQLPPSENQLIEVRLGEDLKLKMGLMFADSEDQLVTSSDAMVPAWLLHQLFLAWQGEPVTRQSCYANEFPRPEEHHHVESDEAIARQLQEEEEANFNQQNGSLDMAQRSQLKYLRQEFSSVDPAVVGRIFADTDFNAAAARDTLHLLLSENDEEAAIRLSGGVAPRIPRIVPSVAPQPQPSQLSGDGRSSTAQTRFEGAQAAARRLLAEAETWAERKADEKRKAAEYHRANGPMNAAGAVYTQHARSFAQNERELRDAAAAVLSEANAETEYLDLHLMTQGQAIRTVRERLRLIDRPADAQKGRSYRRLSVVTGYGKTSGQAVIKPAVERWLISNGYRFSHPNRGEICVECK